MTTKSDIKFTPSLSCKKSFKEHRREETCTELKGDKKYHAIGVCNICGGTKKYEHIDLSKFGSIVQPSKQRDFVLFHNKPEGITHLNRRMVGGV